MPDQKSEKLFQRDRRYIMATYPRQPLLVTRARGATVWDASGRAYLDFVSGLGVCGAGHVNPAVLKALESQARKVWHVSNYYYTRPPVDLAEQLSKRSLGGKVFFCNSGAEANECAVKLARKWADGRFQIVTFDNAFHGRTIAMLAATGQDKFQEGFGPMPEGFIRGRFNDLSSLKYLIGPRTAGILVEPVQGEGGVRVASREFLQGLRRLCDKYQLLLIFDEVQCGLGRTGKLFAYEHSGVVPDILVLAKGLGDGLPIGATLARLDVADCFSVGSHGSTFGGNPLVSCGALEVLKFLNEKRLRRIRALGQRLLDFLNDLRKNCPLILEVRGLGLMIGIGLAHEGHPYVTRARERGLLINCTQGNVIRLLPPFVMTDADLTQGLRILKEVLTGEN